MSYRTALDKARGYIDSDYELLCDMDKKDFHDHLVGMDFDLTREETDILHRDFFGPTFEEWINEQIKK